MTQSAIDAACLLSPAARLDILEIAHDIAADNPDAAIVIVDRLFAAFATLAGQPGLAHRRDDLIPPEAGVGFQAVGPYLVVSRFFAGGLQIVRVLGGYRDIAATLRSVD